MSFPRYPKYKPSGVEWLGEVPEHWEVMPIRRAARLESGHTPSRNHPEYWENCTVPWFTLTDVWQIREERRDVIYETEEKVSELGLAHSSARRLPKGTVMLSRTASVGFSAIMGVEMATTQDFANWVCSERLDPKYLLHVFRGMTGEFARLMMGSTHNTIYMPDIQSLRLALPPMPEQRAIVKFVERETARIDALVAEQERMIELLKEKRQAAISHAVTKGLNPNAPMKPSGIEWLGDVPAHWEVQKLGQRLAEHPCYGVLVPDFAVDGVPMVRIQDMLEGHTSRDSLTTISSALSEQYHRTIVSEGDVLLSVVGTLGKSLVVQRELAGVNLSRAVARVRPAHDLAPNFLCWVFRSDAFDTFVDLVCVGTAQRVLNMSDLRSFQIALPPPEEQLAIAASIASRLQTIDELVLSATAAEALMSERRSALISSAVTGQIDVRTLVPSLVP